MKLKQEQIEHIKTAFAQMQTREDFLSLLNEVKPLIYGDKAVPFSLKQLTWHSNPNLGKKRYRSFTIKKKSGSERNIHAPMPGLLSIQKTLSFILQTVFEPQKPVMGFVRDRSIVDNARMHIGNRYVYNIDLKDFFPSVDQARVWKSLQLKPFNLNDNAIQFSNSLKLENFKEELITIESIAKLDFNSIQKISTNFGEIYKIMTLDEKKCVYILTKNGELVNNELKTNGEQKTWMIYRTSNTTRVDIANTIAAICCAEMEVERIDDSGGWQFVKKKVLPQGAPTSPVLTNIICQRMDFILLGVAKRFGLKYSRYADDITFSSMHNVFQKDSDFLLELKRVIKEQGFYINERKTRLQKDGYRKEVTGLLVNDKVNVQSRYIKQLRMWLYYWERYGYERASGFFLQQYIADKGHIKNGKPEMANVISGKLDYLKMVKGAENRLYMELRNRFEKLSEKLYIPNDRYSHLVEVMQILFNEDIISAMDFYKPKD